MRGGDAEILFAAGRLDAGENAVCLGPAGGFAADDLDLGHVCGVEGGTEDFHEGGGLGAVGEHGGVACAGGWVSVVDFEFSVIKGEAGAYVKSGSFRNPVWNISCGMDGVGRGENLPR